MGKFHEEKEKKKSEKKLVFSYESLENWKQQQEKIIKDRVAAALKAEMEKQVAEHNAAFAADLAKIEEQKAEANKMLSEAYAKLQKAKEDVEDARQNLLDDAVTTTLALLLGISVKVMKEKHGWGKKRLTDFAGALLDEHNSFQEGEMSVKDYQRLLWEMTGVGFTEKAEDKTIEEIQQEYEEWLNSEDA